MLDKLLDDSELTSEKFRHWKDEHQELYLEIRAWGAQQACLDNGAKIDAATPDAAGLWPPFAGQKGNRPWAAQEGPLLLERGWIMKKLLLGRGYRFLKAEQLQQDIRKPLRSVAVLCELTKGTTILSLELSAPGHAASICFGVFINQFLQHVSRKNSSSGVFNIINLKYTHFLDNATREVSILVHKWNSLLKS